MGYKVAQIIKDTYPLYSEINPLPDYVRYACEKIIKCRTEELGGHADICECGYVKAWYNSCKHRFCPVCSKINLDEWAEAQKEKFPKCDYYHIIFTIPEELNRIFLDNKPVFTNIIFRASDETMEHFLQDNKCLGAKTGKCMVFQSWASNLGLHPHIHCLVTAGGIDKDNNWIEPKNADYLFPVKAAMPIFRAKLVSYLRENLKDNNLNLEYDEYTFNSIINSLFYKNWNIYILPKYSYADGVIIYLSRYVRGAPINDKRIENITDDSVTFKYRYTKDKKTVYSKMKLSKNQFLQRLLLHVPPPRKNHVRYYGIFHSSQTNKLNKLRLLYSMAALNKNCNLHSTDKEISRKPESLCPNCNKPLKKLLNLSKTKIAYYMNKSDNKDPPLKKAG